METTKGGNKGAMIPIAPARGGTWRLDMHKEVPSTSEAFLVHDFRKPH